MAIHRADASVPTRPRSLAEDQHHPWPSQRPGEPDVTHTTSTPPADLAMSEWTVDLSVAMPSTRVATTSSFGYVDYDSIDTIHDHPEPVF